MEKVNDFHEKLEADIRRLVAQAQEAGRPGVEGRTGREFLKETLKAYTRETVPMSAVSEAAPAAAQTSGAKEPTSDVLPSYASGAAVPPAVKVEVERLLNVVFNKGLDAGIREARKRSPLVEDMFHDALVDKLLPELEKRGIIK